jgi:hypothetical protein
VFLAALIVIGASIWHHLTVREMQAQKKKKNAATADHDTWLFCAIIEDPVSWIMLY